MIDSTETLLNNLKAKNIQFKDVISTIDAWFDFTPTGFKNGEISNQADQNQGSAKVFSFAQLHHLSEKETLTLFAEHYESVLNNPEGNDHQNIRQFMKYGWNGVQLEHIALKKK